jgi:hypothetical protein
MMFANRPVGRILARRLKRVLRHGRNRTSLRRLSVIFGIEVGRDRARETQTMPGCAPSAGWCSPRAAAPYWPGKTAAGWRRAEWLSTCMRAGVPVATRAARPEPPAARDSRTAKEAGRTLRGANPPHREVADIVMDTGGPGVQVLAGTCLRASNPSKLSASWAAPPDPYRRGPAGRRACMRLVKGRRVAVVTTPVVAAASGRVQRALEKRTRRWCRCWSRTASGRRVGSRWINSDRYFAGRAPWRIR